MKSDKEIPKNRRVLARLTPIIVTDQYLYLFTLSYHIRKSDCKHFPTLMSTLHHRSSLTLARTRRTSTAREQLHRNEERCRKIELKVILIRYIVTRFISQLYTPPFLPHFINLCTDILSEYYASAIVQNHRIGIILFA